jgi:hypothetical protein
MFFWLEYGNGERKMFNTNCRSSILLDHISQVCLMDCVKYVTDKMEEVNESLEDIKLNIAAVNKAEAEKTAEEDGEVGGVEGSEAIDNSDFDPEKVLEQLGEMERLRKLQREALVEAEKKLEGCTTKDLDLAKDDGTLANLSALGNNSAKEVIPPKGSYNLCRVVDGKAEFLRFAVPPDGTLGSLDEILGSRRAVRQVPKKAGQHKRNKTEGVSKKALKDSTNAHRRSHTALA